MERALEETSKLAAQLGADEAEAAKENATDALIIAARETQKCQVEVDVIRAQYAELLVAVKENLAQVEPPVIARQSLRVDLGRRSSFACPLLGHCLPHPCTTR